MRRSLACISLSTALGLGFLMTSTSPVQSARMPDFQPNGRNAAISRVSLDNGNTCNIRLNEALPVEEVAFSWQEGSYSCASGSFGSVIYISYRERPPQTGEIIVLESYQAPEELILVRNGGIFYTERFADLDTGNISRLAGNLAALLPSSTSNQPLNTGQLISQTGSPINIRRRAGMHSPVVDTMPVGTQITVLARQQVRNDLWYEVSLDGINSMGWVRSDLVRVD